MITKEEEILLSLKSKEDLNNEFLRAVESNNQDIVKFCISHKTMYSKLTKEILTKSFEKACKISHISIIQYMINNIVDIQKDLNIEDINTGLKVATFKSDYEGVKYLLTSSELKINPNIHIEKDYVFKIAKENKDDELINYLIWDYQIEETEDIKDICKDSPNLQKVFKTRELQKKLNENLQEKNGNRKLKL